MTVEEWEAHAEFDIGNLILRYLQEHPVPDDSDMASRLREYGEGFRDLGVDSLARLGLRRLAVA